MRTLQTSLLAAVVAFSLAGRAAPDDRRAPEDRSDRGGALVERIVRCFDFNEPENPLPIPVYWVRLAGDGFPHWNTVRFNPPTPDPTDELNRVYRLETRGGDVGVRLVEGVVSVIPLTDYAVTVKLRTLDAERARARVIARLVDVQGKVIPESDIRSDPIQTNGEWTTIRLPIRGDSPDAAWIQVDLTLEQPSTWAPNPSGTSMAARPDDVDAAVEFDDLVISRLPRVTMVAGESNLLVGDEPAIIRVRVDDLTRNRLAGRLRLFDATGALVETAEVDLGGAAGVVEWAPSIDRFGWYRVAIDIIEHDAVVGRSSVDFVRAPETLERPGGLIFGLSNREHPDSVAWTMALGASGFVSPQRVGPNPERPILARRLNALTSIEGRAVLSLRSLEPSVAKRALVSPDDLLAAMSTGHEETWALVDEWLSRYGQRVSRWMIGGPNDASLADRTAVAETTTRLRERIARLTPGAELWTPWPITTGPPPDLDSTSGVRFVLRTPEFIAPESIAAHLDAWEGASERPALWIEPIAYDEYGAIGQASDFARRLVLAWESAPDSIVIDAPWAEPDDGHATPTVLAPVANTVNTMLGGRRSAGRLDFGPDIAALLFQDDDGGGVIAAWSRSTTVERPAFTALLSDEPVRVTDIDGNSYMVEADSWGHRIELGATPVFIDQIDVRMALFRAGFAVLPRFVESATMVHPHEIRLVNPWSETLSGEIRFESPTNWSFEPSLLNFTIPPNSETRLPITFSVPANEVAGVKMVGATARLQADRTLVVGLNAPLEIGLRGVTLQSSYRIVEGAGGRRDVVVTNEITNRSEAPVWMTTFCLAPGFAYQEAAVSDLQPGETTIRNFALRDGADALIGRSIRAGLREVDGPGRLNVDIAIE
ncbi:MAG: hypothetical protein ACF8PN_17355 [Phycisphaerales bacterium]